MVEYYFLIINYSCIISRLAEGKKNYEHQRIEYEEMSEKNRDLQRNLDMIRSSVLKLERRYIHIYIHMLKAISSKESEHAVNTCANTQNGHEYL